MCIMACNSNLLYNLIFYRRVLFTIQPQRQYYIFSYVKEMTNMTRSSVLLLNDTEQCEVLS